MSGAGCSGSKQSKRHQESTAGIETMTDNQMPWVLVHILSLGRVPHPSSVGERHWVNSKRWRYWAGESFETCGRARFGWKNT